MRWKSLLFAVPVENGGYRKAVHSIDAKVIDLLLSLVGAAGKRHFRLVTVNLC
jgi:hypothetical protein